MGFDPGLGASAKKMLTSVDGSDRKFYMRASEKTGNKKILQDFDAALSNQRKQTPPKTDSSPRERVKPMRAENGSDQKFYNMAADRQNKVIDLENRAQALNKSIDALASASPYAAQALQAEVKEVERELAALQGRSNAPPAAKPLFSDQVMTPEQALTVVRDNVDTFDQAAGKGGNDNVVSLNDVKAVANPANGFDPQVRDAAQYLLDNPRLFDRMEVANDGDRFRKTQAGDVRRDDKFNVDDIDRFLEQNQHLRVIYDHADELDAAKHQNAPDGLISQGDLEAAVNATDGEGRPLYSQELRDSAQYLLDNGQFHAELDTASGDRNRHADGDMRLADLHGAILDRQALADDPAAARAFILNGDAHLPGTNISDGNSIPSEGLRALAAAGLRDTSDLTEAVDLITNLPETKDGVRNQLITASYAELGSRYDEFLGDNSGANWAHWGVWASDAVGKVIRNEGGIGLIVPAYTHGATGKQRTWMAEGNLLLYQELAPHLAAFHDEFGNDAAPDSRRLDAFLSRFGPDQQQFANAFEAWYGARFETDPKTKQELTLVGNYNLVEHEQRLVDEPLNKVLTDLPWYADGFNKVTGNLGSDRAFEAIEVTYPGRSTSVVHNVPDHDPNDAAYDNHLIDFDSIGDQRIRDTIEGFRSSGGSDSPGANSLDGTYADDWNEYDERLYYIVQDWRLHHTDAGLLAVDDKNFNSIEWLS